MNPLTIPKLFPRLKEEIRTLLLDYNWLYDKHVTNLYSIVSIADELNVTAATISKALVFHGIKSPSQQELRESSNLRKHGIKNPGEIKENRDKALETMKSKYGGHNWSNNGRRYVRDATCKLLYGNSVVSKSDEIKKKTTQSNISLYNRTHSNQLLLSDDVYNKLTDKEWMYNEHITNQKTLTQIAKELNMSHMSTVMRHLHNHGIQTVNYASSTEELEIVDFIKQLDPTINIVLHDRTIIAPYELDIFLPDYNLAIEYCGLFWHTELAGKGPFYHKTKWERCKAKDIQLLTIFSDEWLSNSPIVKSKIKYLLNKSEDKIYARQCKIIELNPIQKRDFLVKYHIQGNGSGSINYGLTYNNELVACITFKEADTSESWYLNRFATSKTVIGGFSKLLKHAKSNISWTEIITFADLRWSNGALYLQHGFSLDKILRPDYSYVLNNKRIHKFNFRKKQLEKKLTVYDPKLTEWENCAANNISWIWDCGKLRYTIHK
jgi:hypothetical protein